MISKKALKVLGPSPRRRLCGRDGCRQEGVGRGTARCFAHIEEESFKRKKAQAQ